MIVLVWFLIFLIYFAIEFVISLFFTYKISFVSKNDYNKAAVAGATSTFLFMFSTLIAAYVTNQQGFIDEWFFCSALLFLFWTTSSLTIGNFCATLLIPHINKKIEKRKQEKNNKKEEE